MASAGAPMVGLKTMGSKRSRLRAMPIWWSGACLSRYPTTQSVSPRSRLTFAMLSRGSLIQRTRCAGAYRHRLPVRWWRGSSHPKAFLRRVGRCGEYRIAPRAPINPPDVSSTHREMVCGTAADAPGFRPWAIGITQGPETDFECIAMILPQRADRCSKFRQFPQPVLEHLCLRG